MTLKRNTAGDGQQAYRVLGGEAQSMREQSRQHPGVNTLHWRPEGDNKRHARRLATRSGSAHGRADDDYDVPY